MQELPKYKIQSLSSEASRPVGNRDTKKQVQRRMAFPARGSKEGQMAQTRAILSPSEVQEDFPEDKVPEFNV